MDFTLEAPSIVDNMIITATNGFTGTFGFQKYLSGFLTNSYRIIMSYEGLFSYANSYRLQPAMKLVHSSLFCHF